MLLFDVGEDVDVEEEPKASTTSPSMRRSRSISR
jgi:hypothetical protein